MMMITMIIRKFENVRSDSRRCRWPNLTVQRSRVYLIRWFLEVKSISKYKVNVLQPREDDIKFEIHFVHNA